MAASGNTQAAPFFLNAVDDVEPRRIYTEVQVYPSSSLLDLLLVIAGEKRTGSLTINFAGGKPDGTVEWKQRVKNPSS